MRCYKCVSLYYPPPSSLCDMKYCYKYINAIYFRRRKWSFHNLSISMPFLSASPLPSLWFTVSLLIHLMLFVFNSHVHFCSPFGQFGRESSLIKNTSIQNTLINSSRKSSLYRHMTGRGLSDWGVVPLLSFSWNFISISWARTTITEYENDFEEGNCVLVRCWWSGERLWGRLH